MSFHSCLTNHASTTKFPRISIIRSTITSNFKFQSLGRIWVFDDLWADNDRRKQHKKQRSIISNLCLWREPYTSLHNLGWNQVDCLKCYVSRELLGIWLTFSRLSCLLFQYCLVGGGDETSPVTSNLQSFHKEWGDGHWRVKDSNNNFSSGSVVTKGLAIPSIFPSLDLEVI